MGDDIFVLIDMNYDGIDIIDMGDDMIIGGEGFDVVDVLGI